MTGSIAELYNWTRLAHWLKPGRFFPKQVQFVFERTCCVKHIYAHLFAYNLVDSTNSHLTNGMKMSAVCQNVYACFLFVMLSGYFSKTHATTLAARWQFRRAFQYGVGFCSGLPWNIAIAITRIIKFDNHSFPSKTRYPHIRAPALNPKCTVPCAVVASAANPQFSKAMFS